MVHDHELALFCHIPVTSDTQIVHSAHSEERITGSDGQGLQFQIRQRDGPLDVPLTVIE